MNSFLNFHVTVQGASHIRKGIVCQDNSKSCCSGDSCVAAVADGHGDIRYFRSDAGSRFAVEAAIKAVKEFVRQENTDNTFQNMDEDLNQLKKNIILNWNNKIAKHFAANPFTDEELSPLSASRRMNLQNGKYIESAYGTTLIAAAVTPKFWFGLQIGDGDCSAILEDGQLVVVPRESGLVGNVTTSLCEPDAIDKFHHIFSAEVPASVIMSTDGVKNSFTSCENYHRFVQKIINEFVSSPFRETKENLQDFMAEMTAKGSGDDLSIAGIINKEKLLNHNSCTDFAD